MNSTTQKSQNKKTAFRSVKIGRAVYKVNEGLGFFPYFTMTLRRRVNTKKANNIAIVGEAGVSKSYAAWTLALELDRRFSINQIVYTYSEYMRLIRKLGIGRAIVFDEPSYAMGKRDWYKQLNKVLVQTIESQRFKVHPLFIPIINMSLLDKTIRDHLIQFVVLMIDRGIGYVYRLYPSQWEDKVYRNYLCTIKLPLIGTCERPSCIGCRKLKQKCKEFRAQYERKKLRIQDERYEQAEVDAQYVETREMTDTQLATIAHSFHDEITDEDGKISANKMKAVLLYKLNMKVGLNRSYAIVELLRLMYPDDYS